MSKKSAYIIRATAFILLSAFLFFEANRIFSSSYGKGYGYEFLPENTVDVVICGASSIGTGISPSQLWDEYGITACNTFTTAQVSFCTYYLFSDFLLYQDPKYVVLDTSVLWHEYAVDEGYYEPFIHSALERMKMTSVKLDMIRDIAAKSNLKNALSYFFPIIRYHEQWKNMPRESLKALFMKRSDGSYDMGLGQQIFPDHISAEPLLPIIAKPSDGAVSGSDAMQTVNNIESVEISPQAMEYFDKLVDLCSKNDIKVILIKLPSPNWDYEKHAFLENYSELHNADFIDYNTDDKLADIALNYETDFYNVTHLNMFGAHKATSDLGKYITEKYGSEDHRDNEAFEVYAAASEEYKKMYESLAPEGDQ